MEWSEIFQYLHIITYGAVIGYFIGLTGVGGGALMIPSLVLAFDLPTSIAIGTASFYAVVTKIFACTEHIRIKNFNPSLTFFMLLGAIPAAFTCSFIVNKILTEAVDGGKSFQQFLTYAVVCTLIFCLLLIVNNSRYVLHKDWWFIVLGIFDGCVMGITGIGGGVLIVPLLMKFSHETPKKIVGSALIIALLVSLTTSTVYANKGQIDWNIAIFASIGSLIAVPFYSLTLSKISQDKLQLAIKALIVMATFAMLFKQWGIL